MFTFLGLLSSGPAGMFLKSGYHPEGSRDLSFGNLRGFEVRSPGGVAVGTGRPVGVRRNSPCISRQGLFGGRFSVVAERVGALRFRTWMLSNPVDVSKGWVCP